MTDAWEELTGSFDPALVIVTTALDGERAGCLVGFHTQSSMDPPRYCVWLSKANHTARVAQRASHLAVHAVPVGQLALVQRFGSETGDAVDKFAGLTVRDGPGGVPLLAACPAGVVLRRCSLLDEGGDHLCITGEVVDAWSAAFDPVRQSRVADLEPGHENTERPHPPTERAD